MALKEKEKAGVGGGGTLKRIPTKPERVANLLLPQEGAGRFPAETSQEDFIAPELSKLLTLSALKDR